MRLKNKVIINAGWIIGCRIIQAVLSFVISLFTARYLGPSNFGIINYAASIVAFVTPVAKLGLPNILVQETVLHPEEEGEIYGTSLGMSMISSAACIIGVFLYTRIAHANEPETILVCCLYSLLVIVQALEVILCWFQSKLLAKYTSVISIVAYLVISIYKLYLLATNKSILWFALSNTIDYLIISVTSWVVYKKLTRTKIRWSWSVMKRLFNTGKYYIVSNLMIVFFSQTSVVMIKWFCNNEVTGYYSLAVSCALTTQFVFSAIIESARPKLVEISRVDPNAFEHRMTQVYSLLIYLALAQSVGMTVLAKPFVKLLYGEAYLPAASILQVYVWQTIFSYYGGAKDIWILINGHQKKLIVLNLYGAVANVALNILFIANFGATGAAFAIVLSQFFTNVVLFSCIKSLRQNNKLFMNAIKPSTLIGLIKNNL